MIQQIILPLHSATISIRLPKSAHIVGAGVRENDVSYLEVAALKEEWDEAMHGGPKKDTWSERTVEVYFEGELRGGEPVAIPEASEKRRFIGTFKTKETPATWHIFEQVQPTGNN